MFIMLYVGILLLITVIEAKSISILLQWSANKEPDLVGYKIYGTTYTTKVATKRQPPFNTYTTRTTRYPFKCLSTLHKQTTGKVIVSGTSNWRFYVTARNAVQESHSSNNVYVPRGAAR